MVHPMFHTSLIWAHVPNDDGRFPHRDAKSYYNSGSADKHEWFIDKILGHQWVNQDKLELQTHWTPGNVTWEPLVECKERKALDEYLDLHSVMTLGVTSAPSTSCTWHAGATPVSLAPSCLV